MQSSRVRRARALEERQLLSSTIPHAAQHRQISGPRTTPTPAEAQIRLTRPCGLPAVRAVTQQQRTVGIWVCCSLLLLCVHLSSCSSPPPVPRPPAPSPSSSSSPTATTAAAMGSYVSTVAPAATAAAPPVQPTLIVVGSGLAGLTTALRFLQVRHSSHNEQFHFGHFHFGGLLSLWWFWWFCYLAWLLCALCYQAAKIKDPSKQYKVVILEADSVAGGRTRSTVLDKLPATAPPVSYGGTWVILQDDSLVGLSNEVRLRAPQCAVHYQCAAFRGVASRWRAYARTHTRYLRVVRRSTGCHSCRRWYRTLARAHSTSASSCTRSCC